MKKSLILLSVFISIISSKSYADDTDAIVNSAVDKFTSNPVPQIIIKDIMKID